MRLLTLLICPTVAASRSTVPMIDFASPLAWRAMSAEVRAWLEICSTDCAISSAAMATLLTFVVASSDAVAVALACVLLCSAASAMICAQRSIVFEAASSA